MTGAVAGLLAAYGVYFLLVAPLLVSSAILARRS